MNILVFKTNIRLKKDLQIIRTILSDLESVLKWNVDRHDIDKILRIESTSNDTNQIIKTINQAGYHCEELRD